jgi:hypothetical protein
MRSQILVCAVLGLVLSTPAEAQNLRMALAAAADFTPVYPFAKIPANIREIVAIAELGTEKPRKLVASYCRAR